MVKPGIAQPHSRAGLRDWKWDRAEEGSGQGACGCGRMGWRTDEGVYAAEGDEAIESSAKDLGVEDGLMGSKMVKENLG